jgi:hypothetical protein
MRPNAAVAEVFAAAFCASGLLVLAIACSQAPVFAYAQSLAHLRDEAQLVVLGAIGACAYGAALFAGLKLLGVSFTRPGA